MPTHGDTAQELFYGNKISHARSMKRKMYGDATCNDASLSNTDQKNT
jgi:hypothetical protein